MSRSYRKSPVATDSHAKSTQEKKKFANKKVRNAEDVPNGGAYKKVSDSWDIRDHKSYWTWEEAKNHWESEIEKGNVYYQKHFPTLKIFHRWWLGEYQVK